MKKLFALILAVIMICAMSVNVFAEDTATKNIVGSYGGSNGINNGVKEDAFQAIDPNVTVDIKATAGNIEHRYAVDIEYDVMSIDVVNGGKLIWNVNTLQYETDGASTVPADVTFDAAVKNYSDLPVNLTVTVTDNDANDGVSVKAYEDNSTDTALSTNPIKINDATSGTAGVCAFDIQVKADGKTWTEIANYYADYFTTQNKTSATMATLTITVAKVPVTP